MEATTKLGLFARKTQLTWEVLNQKALAVIAPQLEAIRIYRTQVHKEADTVSVVLSKPPEPKPTGRCFEKILTRHMGPRKYKGLTTYDCRAGTFRLAVMTPYLDEVGAEIVLALFKKYCPVRKQLVIRLRPGVGLPPDFICRGSQATRGIRL